MRVPTIIVRFLLTKCKPCPWPGYGPNGWPALSSAAKTSLLTYKSCYSYPLSNDRLLMRRHINNNCLFCQCQLIIDHNQIEHYEEHHSHFNELQFNLIRCLVVELSLFSLVCNDDDPNYVSLWNRAPCKCVGLSSTSNSHLFNTNRHNINLKTTWEKTLFCATFFTEFTILCRPHLPCAIHIGSRSNI